ncbi:MAG TPA: MarR family winged helix-turn-helix transcriptional regulator [Burkholderiales bacterium]|nr:MarR family winged helix-turn-helix transcriptional regulator [Burkholderiales bacterium]
MRRKRKPKRPAPGNGKRSKLKNVGEKQEQLASQVLKKFRQVLKSTKKYFQKVDERCGLSGAQLWVLWELGQMPGMRISDLATSLAIKQPSATNLVDKLEERELIRRERNGSDRRVVRLYLTRRADKLIARAPTPAQGLLPDALSRIPGKTLRDLDTNLSLLLKVMKPRDQSAAMMPLSDLLS